MSAGTYSVNYSTERLSSGIYFYRITANEYNETKKMVLTK
ncbi:MAG: T9SS type A sorting domain-containing protein [Ignavibacteria bacterium]|nr:T9SS type A sorting domain-containing protein [Ignavibacteria bacterium]